jgi:hypothetical protein
MTRQQAFTDAGTIHSSGARMDGILERSRATAAFKADVIAFCQGRQAERVEVRGYAPPVKIERVLTQLLHAEPHLEIERMSVAGRSGCSDFSGSVVVQTTSGPRTFDFVWDCRWRAEQEGWQDCFGFPDQIRAAREFGWQCFEKWTEQPSVLLVESAEAAQTLS